MSAEATTPMRHGRRWIWLLVGAGLALVIGANWHLVYVAVTSQPDCVAHVRAGDDVRGGGDGAPGSFSAAKSSCTPR